MAGGKRRNQTQIAPSTASRQDGTPIASASSGGGGGGAPAAHAATHQNGGSDEVNVAGLSGVLADPQPPIIGAGAAQAVAGNDARLTNARTPTAHAVSHASGGSDVVTLAEAQITNLTTDLAGKVATARQVLSGTGLTGGGDLSADRTLAADFGSGAGKVTQGNDSRLSDARAPTGSAGGDLAGTYPNPTLAAPLHVQGFRLTLTSNLPVTTADVIGATTVYACPYVGNRIALYDGSNWNIRSSAQFNLALGTLTSGKPYDVFCYDNAGTPTLEFLAWTNDTTRATALVYQDGVLVKSGATTRRYLGSFYTTAATTTEDSQKKRFLWNYYNRVARAVAVQETTGSWTYTTSTFRQMNGNAANQIEVLVGVAEDEIFLMASVTSASSNTSSSVNTAIGIGEDSTTTIVTRGFISGFGQVFTGTNFNIIIPFSVQCSLVPPLGKHFYAALEWSQTGGTTTWYSGATVVTGLAAGIVGRWRA